MVAIPNNNDDAYISIQLFNRKMQLIFFWFEGDAGSTISTILSGYTFLTFLPNANFNALISDGSQVGVIFRLFFKTL